MNRFFGLMPSNEVEIQRKYKDCFDNDLIIQAGQKGWTIVYVNGSSTYKDEELTAKENFDNAYKYANNELGILTEIE